MATYFHCNPDIHATDGLQTLVLMNPGYVQYLDSPPTQAAAANLVFINSNSSQQPQQLVGIPLPAGPTSHDISAVHGFVHGVHYNMYNPIHTSGARETPRAQQGLSLSLSASQQPGYGSEAVSGGLGSSGSGLNCNRVFLNSKYLKAAQELLDEVVNVNNSELLTKKGDDGNKSNSSTSTREPSAVAGDGSGGCGEAGAERSTADKQEIQMKKAKLISMLDEVEQRYRQYHHQMQAVTSSFEQAAGLGSSKSYTSLALKTISKQFRCLKDAIASQIRAANKSLGEEEDGKIDGSRLKFVDHHLRQQRALQQLGMVQHSNAWRPQRGLPERSVSVLRAWLFEHFLHPYPKDSDKHMLAKQTGLTRSQVSNWFINSRVRLWKPMVEEMYAEEIKAQEQNGTTSEDKTSKEDSNKKHAESRTASSTSPVVENSHNRSSFSCIGSSELEGIAQESPKKPRSNEMLPSMNMDINQSDGSMKFSKDVYSFMGTNTDYMGGFGNYPVGEFGRFDTEQLAPRFQGNGVSLTLGPSHCENISLSATHQNFLPNQTIQTETLMNNVVQTRGS